MQDTKSIVEREQEGISLNEGQGRLLWGSDIKTDPYIWGRINPPEKQKDGSNQRSPQSSEMKKETQCEGAWHVMGKEA